MRTFIQWGLLPGGIALSLPGGIFLVFLDVRWWINPSSDPYARIYGTATKTPAGWCLVLLAVALIMLFVKKMSMNKADERKAQAGWQFLVRLLSRLACLGAGIYFGGIGSVFLAYILSNGPP
ncbi:MAG: hypothetical protein NTY46_16780 [Candidatus Sumerlaeota bacterium]|nr:hypothetical protein [Candidatus Sumerlaeota bacterium]